jgi:metal-sulfur cluster biosynthetic enzyme
MICESADQGGARGDHGVAGVERLDVELTFDPPWTPDRIRA